MSRRVTVLYMNDTGQVIGAFTRNANPNGQIDIADMAGPGVGYWVSTFQPQPPLTPPAPPASSPSPAAGSSTGTTSTASAPAPPASSPSPAAGSSTGAPSTTSAPAAAPFPPAVVPIPAEALDFAVVDVDQLRELFINPGGYFVDTSQVAKVLAPVSKSFNVTSLKLTFAGDLTITTDPPPLPNKPPAQPNKPPPYIAILELDGETRPPARGTPDPVPASSASTPPLTIRFKVGSLDSKPYHVLIFAAQQGIFATQVTPVAPT